MIQNPSGTNLGPAQGGLKIRQVTSSTCTDPGAVCPRDLCSPGREGGTCPGCHLLLPCDGRWEPSRTPAAPPCPAPLASPCCFITIVCSSVNRTGPEQNSHKHKQASSRAGGPQRRGVMTQEGHAGGPPPQGKGRQLWATTGQLYRGPREVGRGAARDPANSRLKLGATAKEAGLFLSTDCGEGSLTAATATAKACSAPATCQALCQTHHTSYSGLRGMRHHRPIFQMGN